MAVATAISDIGAIDVRDRADVRRQIKLVSLFGIVLVLLLVFYWRIDDFHVVYTLGERVTLDEPAKPLNGKPIMIGAIVVTAVALALAVANQVRKGWIAWL